MNTTINLFDYTRKVEKIIFKWLTGNQDTLLWYINEDTKTIDFIDGFKAYRCSIFASWLYPIFKNNYQVVTGFNFSLYRDVNIDMFANYFKDCCYDPEFTPINNYRVDGDYRIYTNKNGVEVSFNNKWLTEFEKLGCKYLKLDTTEKANIRAGMFYLNNNDDDLCALCLPYRR